MIGDEHHLVSLWQALRCEEVRMFVTTETDDTIYLVSIINQELFQTAFSRKAPPPALPPALLLFLSPALLHVSK